MKVEEGVNDDPPLGPLGAGMLWGNQNKFNQYNEGNGRVVKRNYEETLKAVPHATLSTILTHGVCNYLFSHAVLLQGQLPCTKSITLIRSNRLKAVVLMQYTICYYLRFQKVRLGSSLLILVLIEKEERDLKTFWHEFMNPTSTSRKSMPFTSIIKKAFWKVSSLKLY